MKLITFGPKPEKTGPSLTQRMTQNGLVKVGGTEVGGFSKGLGQGVGIGAGLLAFGMVFAFLRGKRVG